MSDRDFATVSNPRWPVEDDLLYEEARVADYTAWVGDSLVAVVLVAIPLCQVQSRDANQRHNSVSYAMILKSTPVMRAPANPPS
jgi:hypothetical protein